MGRIRFLVPMLAVAMMGSACVEDIGSMLVVKNSVLGGACELNAELEGNFRSRGTLDVMLTNRYFLFPTVQNQLRPSSDVKIKAQAGGVTGDFRDVLNEGNAITLEGATVSFTTPPNVSFALPQNVFIPTSGTVFPQGLTTTQLEVLSVDIGNIVRRAPEFFDAANETFRKGAVVTVLVTIKFQGRTTSGTEIESNEFTYPMDLCAGCLLVYSPGTLFIDDDNSLTCDTSKATGDDNQNIDSAVETPCLIGQDDVVDCRLCRTLAADDLTADALCDP